MKKIYDKSLPIISINNIPYEQLCDTYKYVGKYFIGERIAGRFTQNKKSVYFSCNDVEVLKQHLISSIKKSLSKNEIGGWSIINPRSEEGGEIEHSHYFIGERK